ncbi:unnamed protein product [Rangifer tarandus platyrhynchus]|uniref:Uncharacterized protein n=1 Tax=Rangifer tarandus platyrhynchus TaxID=3082113 RepID=A0AC59ZAU1_RANTA
MGAGEMNQKTEPHSAAYPHTLPFRPACTMALCEQESPVRGCQPGALRCQREGSERAQHCCWKSFKSPCPAGEAQRGKQTSEE